MTKSRFFAVDFLFWDKLLDLKDPSYFSYELNLVLDDGSRVNVLDHSRKARVLKDANLLSNLLKIPTWDVSI